MSQLFTQVLHLSYTASWVIVCVFLARLLLCAAPRRYTYALWAVVLLRLLCPLSLESPISLIPALEPTAVVSWAGDETVQPDRNGFPVDKPIEQTEPAAYTAPAAVSRFSLEGFLTRFGPMLWLAGIAVLLGYSFVSLARLHRRLQVSLPIGDGVWLADGIGTPFVIGLLRPRIYLPSDLPVEERAYILLHERTHIRRGDPFFKLTAFLALCIHWFNPLVWLAFFLSVQDMEASCDERVLALSREDIRGAYSASLLRLASGHRVIAGAPLAFGEGRTSSRIKNVLHYKKPAFWLSALTLLAVIVLTVCLLTDQPNRSDPALVVGEYDISTLGGSFLTGGDTAYSVGANVYGMPIFVDPDAAFAALQRDYAEGLAFLAKAYDLPILDRQNYAWYKNFGMQTDSDDPVLRSQCVEISQFLDLYENSFRDDRPNGEATTAMATGSGSYDVGALLGQYGALSFQPTDGSVYDRIILNHYSLTVLSSDGSVRFTSKGNSVSQMVRSALLQRLTDCNVMGMDEDDVPNYSKLEDMMVYSYYNGEDESDVAYSVYWFEGEPIWFAEGVMLRIYQLSPI